MLVLRKGKFYIFLQGSLRDLISCYEERCAANQSFLIGQALLFDKATLSLLFINAPCVSADTAMIPNLVI